MDAPYHGHLLWLPAVCTTERQEAVDMLVGDMCRMRWHCLAEIFYREAVSYGIVPIDVRRVVWCHGQAE